MRTLPALGLTCAVVWLVGCHDNRLPPPPNVGRYSCLEVPSGFERPGVLFRQAQNGQLFLVADLFTAEQRQANVLRETNVQNVVARRTGTTSGNLAFGLLEKLIPGVTASVSASLRNQWDGSVTYRGLDEERTFDGPVHDLARRWIAANQLLPENQYFLIRDALRARSITMELTQQQARETKIEAAFEAVVNVNAGATLDRGAVYSLNSPLNPPLYVCITQENVSDITPPGAPGGTAAVPREIVFQPVSGGGTLPQIQRLN